jgi:thioredoxin-dependent peroxiredoxin
MMIKKISRFMLACQLLLAASAHALLAPGVAAPDFTAEAALAGQPFTYTLSEALKKGPVVLYFYPKAFTRGCTVEAHLFAKAQPEFSALGATVIGISADPIEKQKEFSLKECSNTLPVAADPDGKVVKAYDASMMFGSDTSKRATYVITPDSKIFYVYSDINPNEHVNESLNALKRWKAAQQPAGQ